MNLKEKIKLDFEKTLMGISNDKWGNNVLNALYAEARANNLNGITLLKFCCVGLQKEIDKDFNNKITQR